MVDDVRLVAFDLDDTLAPSKSPLPPRMGAALGALLDEVPVAVISGGHFGQFRSQVLEHLDARADQLARLHLLPTNGTRYYRFEGGEWVRLYAHDLQPAERDRVVELVELEAKRLGLWESETWGPIMEDRGSQITFSALGQQAPVEAKRAWDPTGDKREQLRVALAPLLPELEVRSGGSTSVDITLKGVDKAYGMKRLSEHTGIALDAMLFVGDRLDEGGNDFPVRALGVRTHPVTGWQDAVEVVEALVGTPVEG